MRYWLRTGRVHITKTRPFERETELSSFPFSIDIPPPKVFNRICYIQSSLHLTQRPESTLTSILRPVQYSTHWNWSPYRSSNSPITYPIVLTLSILFQRSAPVHPLCFFKRALLQRANPTGCTHPSIPFSTFQNWNMEMDDTLFLNIVFVRVPKPHQSKRAFRVVSVLIQFRIRRQGR